jgi:dipeptidyl aminopeptidase/acylaminoacyl peptidase
MTQQSVTQRPYGTWTSPVSISDVINGGLKLGDVRLDGNQVYWTESRPAEGGRTVIMRFEHCNPVELVPAPFNVRSRVHEYGGGAWLVADGTIVFANFTDNRLYRIDSANPEPVAITPESAWRYADLQLDPVHNRLFAIREDHSTPDAEAVNTLVVLDPAGPNQDGGTILVSGTDFVAAPTLDHAGTRLAWLSWNHPNMPWDGCDLFSAAISAENELTDFRHVAGGAEESIFQPRWLPDGRLGFVSDRSGWWNLYAANDDNDTVALTARESEFGLPAWQFGASTWDIVSDTTLVVSWTNGGLWSIGKLDLASGELHEYEDNQPYTVFSGIRAVPGENAMVCIAGSATEPAQLVRFDLASGEYAVLRGSEITIDRANFSVPESIEWQAPDGATAYGFFYSPTNASFTAPSGELPPLIVESHGGPTGATNPWFSYKVQFWTSRGFAILEVNYGGSTGFGREYRKRLNDNWGIVDVQDCISGVEALVARKLVDPERVIIRGGSAGGFTTLAALTTSNVFRIGTSYYGVGELEALATDTHKCESRYLDNLVGAYPERKDLYDARSPIHHTDRLSAAMLLLQGLDDKVVPPNQSASMAAAVRAKQLPVALIEFEGEGHGFRGETAQRRSLEAELSFYSQIFGFALPEPVTPVEIENLP